MPSSVCQRMRILLAVSCLLLFPCTIDPVFPTEGESPAGTAEAETAVQLIEQGDLLHDRMDREGSLECYRRALEPDSRNAELLWRLSRAHYDLGKAAEDKDRQGEYYRKAEHYAREAIRVDPRNPRGHLWLSISVGMVALFEGGKEKVELSREVKSEAEKTIELDPAEDIAYHVLARWHFEVATLNWFLRGVAKVVYGGLPPASREESIRLFEKAIELEPEWIDHHLELGKVYLDMGERDKGRAELGKALSLPVIDIEDPAHKEEAGKILKEMDEN